MRGTLRGVGWGTWIDWQLELTGACSGDSLLMRGTNQIEGEPWVYDYHARLVRTWPQAVDARPVLTGSVVRTQGRQRHDAVAGVHATFIAIKHDAAP